MDVPPGHIFLSYAIKTKRHLHCRTILSLSEQIQVSLRRTKMIPIQAGELKHLLFAFKIQVEVQLQNWRSLCTELHPRIMCRFSHLLWKGWTVCQTKSILYQIRLNYNKRPVSYAWFVNRNIQFFINIFPLLYLSSFFQIWRKCKVH